MTSSRRLPFGVAQYWWRYHWFRKKPITPTGPFYINVEPTSYCNIRCRLCSYDYTRKAGYMDVDLYERIINQAARLNIHEVAHFLAGEPLLHPELPYMIEYATLAGMESRLHTNATLLTEEKSRQLLDAGLSFLGVSFDGEDAETYNAMRRGSDFDLVIDNLRTFLRLKQERGGLKPAVTLKVVKKEVSADSLEDDLPGGNGNGNGHNGNGHHGNGHNGNGHNGNGYGDGDDPTLAISEEFRGLFEGLPVDSFKVIHPHDWRGEVKHEVPHVAVGDCYYPCMVLWGTLSIGWDGRVLGCAADLNGHDILGDLNEQTIMEVWNSEMMQKYRELHRTGRYQEIDLCRDCTFVWWGKNPHLSYLASKAWARPMVGVGKAMLTGTRWVGKERRSKLYR